MVDEDISRSGRRGSEELEERAPAVPRPPAVRPPVEVGKRRMLSTANNPSNRMVHAFKYCTCLLDAVSTRNVEDYYGLYRLFKYCKEGEDRKSWKS